MLCTGISFAVWNYNFLGETNKIDTGEVSLELLESNTDIISIENALPISDETGKTLNETFDFAVTTKASKNLEIGYSLYLEKIYTKCSEIENPSKETYPSCYFNISEESKNKLINGLANMYSVTTDQATTLYNAIIAHDKEGIYNYFISIGWSEEDAQNGADSLETAGYEADLIDWYQNDTGETITYDYTFNGDNVDSSQFLKDNEVKIYLEDYEGNVLISPTKISSLGDNYILYNDTNIHSKTNTKQTDKFKLRVWVDKDVEAGNWDENTKLEYKFKIGVKIPQEETNATLMIGRSFKNLINDSFGGGYYNDSIKIVEFKTSQSVIDTSNAVDGKVLDVSEEQDGSVIAWVEGTSSNYTLYIATTKDTIYANPDSSYMFDSFVNLTTINANKLNVSKVLYMGEMFQNTYKLYDLDLNTWDTSKVTNGYSMFCGSGVTSDILITGPKWTLGSEIFECGAV
ncbi:MAG: BspA family leucine-rich repeat surface protein [Bacilli bacterium]